MGDVSELMEETINRVRQGSLDLRSANTIGFLANVQMKAIAEKRTEAREDEARQDGGFMYEAIFERMRRGLVVSPQWEAWVQQEPAPLYPEPRHEGAAVGTEAPLAYDEFGEETQTPPSAPNNDVPVIMVEVG